MKLKSIVIAISMAGIVGLTGCSATNPRIGELEDQLRVKEQENQELRSSLETAQVQPASETTPASVVVESDLLPPNAKTGECYARVWVPVSYRDLTKEVLVSEESEKVDIIPAEYGYEEETVMVKEASSRLETVPAVYGTETETIQVKEATREWRTSLAKQAALASKELLNAAKSHGSDLDSATPGMCFHEHYLPAKFTTEDQEVLVSEASEQVSVSAPQYRMVEKQVLVKEASFRMEEVPAVYKWEEEQVIDKPAHTVWKKGSGPIQKINEATGEIMCLVEVPATYKTIRRRALETAATSHRVEIPAEYKTVKVRELAEEAAKTKTAIPAKYKTVKVTKKLDDGKIVWHEVHNMEHPTSTRTGLKICLVETAAQYKTITRRVVTTPATTRKVEIPAEYKMVKVRKLITGAQEKRTKIPAEYKTVHLKELEKEGFMEWRSILCETNMTGARITEIQSALKLAGYDPGAIDGVVGAETMAAVNAFQSDKGLPVDKYLNLQTLEALGVSTR
ncbi:MAG: peptidoglycan-binding domain-containing protein [Pseudomonadota bacterium]